jgi:prepilin-type N-terminal cleavage/methylation domain-containing protein
VSRSPADTPHRGHHEGGLTLVELLVVMTIMGLVSAILLNLLDRTTSLVARASADVQAENEGQQALRTMTQDIRAASPVSPPIAFTGSTTGACPTVPTPGTCLRFTILRGTIAFPACQSTITYGLLTDWVQRTRSDANCSSDLSVSRKLVSSVANGSTPLFTYHAADGAVLTSGQASASSVRVTLQISYQGGRQPITLTSTLSLRNAR